MAVSQCRVKRESDSVAIDRGAKGEARCASHEFIACMHRQQRRYNTLIKNF